MSYEAQTWAKEQKTGSPTRKAVLLQLANYADGDGLAFPGQQTLSEDLELSERAVRKALGELESGGFLTIEHRFWENSGKQRTNHYHLCLGRNVVPGGAERGATPGAERGAAEEPSTTELPTEPIREVFEKFWSDYPSRRGSKGSKKNAYAAWRRLSAAKREQAMTALPAYREVAGEYPRDAERYLKHELWEGIDLSTIEPPADDGLKVLNGANF